MTSKDDRPVWHKRLGKMLQESFDFIGSNAKRHRESVAVRAIPKRDGDYRVVYRFGVRGELLPDDVVEDFRDILARGRSVLDISIFTAVMEQANPPLTDREQRNTYFPIAATEAAWRSAEGHPYMKALTDKQRKRLRAIQPFVTGDAVIAEFAKIHNDDKHQMPMTLGVIPDPEFVMIWDHLDPPREMTREWWIDWVEPLPAVENGVDFVEYRSLDPIIDAGIEDVPIALAVLVNGEWRDVQHMLWDVMEFITRASSILHDGDVGLANAFKELFGLQRAQLAAFKKMMLEHDPDAEAEWLRLSGSTDLPHEQRGAHGSHGALSDGHFHPPTSAPSARPRGR